MIFEREFSKDAAPMSESFEYPRPQFKRDSYLDLNGEWDYAIRKINKGQVAPMPEIYDGKITVPYSPESPLSGVNRQLQKDEYLFYHKRVTLPNGFFRGRLLLNIGACDQCCTVFVNGHEVGGHEGGYLPFTLDLTEFWRENEENEIVIRVTDDADSDVYGRGKQFYKPYRIWYTATSGLWQYVFLESVPLDYIKKVKLTPLYDEKALQIELTAEGKSDGASYKIYGENGAVYSGEIAVNEKQVAPMPEFLPWSPDSPHLYKIVFTMGDDVVESYFGMRKFSKIQKDGKQLFAINDRPVFLNGLLDQGYFGEGYYTPRTTDELYLQVKAVKELGFNMLRKHIKVEPYLWYYYCDILGVVVWQDMLNAGEKYSELLLDVGPFIQLNLDDKKYKARKRGNPASRAQYKKEACELIDALYNVVSLQLWTPFNEGWGQFDTLENLQTLQEKDPTRLYDHASGWFDKGAGDVHSRHVYFKKYKPENDGKRVTALTEFGGYSFDVTGKTKHKFGYKVFTRLEDFCVAYSNLFRGEILPAIRTSGLCATVYTQLTDVEGEINGIFTSDGKLKLDETELKAINAELYRAFEETHR